MKVFQTQLQGLLNKYESMEEELEDIARIIAQTIVSDGQLWIYGEKEMHGITDQAMQGADPLPTMMRADKNTAFSSLDTVLIWSPDPVSKDASAIVKGAADKGAQIIGFSSELKTRSDNGTEPALWTEKCSLSISTKVKNGLVPTEDGNRIGTPHLLTALHLYYLIYFTIMEILEEHEM